MFRGAWSGCSRTGRHAPIAVHGGGAFRLRGDLGCKELLGAWSFLEIADVRIALVRGAHHCCMVADSGLYLLSQNG